MSEQANETAKPLSRSQRRRRDDIIQAALKVFDEKGFEAAKMADIAAKAEVAKGTLYLYFYNKVSLMEGVVEAAILPTLQRIGEAAEAHNGTAGELLTQQMRIAARRMASPEMKTLLRHMISGGSQHQQIIANYYEHVVRTGVDLFRQTLRMGVESGEFRSEALKIDPLVLVGSNVYAAVWNNLFADRSALDIERLVDDQLELIMRGLLVSR